MTTKSNTMLIIIAEIIILILLLFGVFISSNAQTKQTAVIDTVVCKVSCIQKFVEIPNTTTGKVKTFAVYIDKDNNIDELIPVSSPILDYIKLCKENSIVPTLGIRLRNGQISSIIRYRQKFRIYYEKR